jgi:hypothetical protein
MTHKGIVELLHPKNCLCVNGDWTNIEFDIWCEFCDKGILTPGQENRFYLEIKQREAQGDFRHHGPLEQYEKTMAQTMPKIIAENKAHDALPFWRKKLPEIGSLFGTLAFWIAPPPGL